MKEWWKQRSIHRRDWIIENLKLFSFTCEELIAILVIDYMNEYHESISHDTLGERMNLDNDKVDDILSSLKVKGYLTLVASDKGIVFNIDDVFSSFDSNLITIDQSSFDLFESEFKRPLSQYELQTLSEWMREYDHILINYALREALTYDKLSFSYIGAILARWKSENFSVKDYEDGKR